MTGKFLLPEEGPECFLGHDVPAGAAAKVADDASA